jgi:hypothetical protein
VDVPDGPDPVLGLRSIRAPTKTTILYEKTLKMLLITLRLAGIPLLRPLHSLAADLLVVVYGD